MSVKGLNCKNDIPQAQKEADVMDNVKSIANEIGMNEQCQKLMTSRSRTESSSGGTTFSGKAGPFGILGKVGGAANFQHSKTGLDALSRAKGCGSIFYTTKTIMENVRRINCTLTQSTSESRALIKGAARVRIVVTPAPGALDRLLKQQAILVESVAKLRNSPKIAAGVQKTVDDITKSIVEFGSVTMKDSTVRASVGSKVRQIAQLDMVKKSKLRTTYQTIAKTTAENTMEQNGGSQAVQGSVKSLIQDRVQRRIDDINADIDQTVSKTRVDVDQSGDVTISAPTMIKLVNTVIDSNVEIDLVTQSLTKNAIQMGKAIAAETVADLATATSSSMSNAGVDAQQKEQGIINASAIAEQSKGLAAIKPEEFNITTIIGLIVVLIVVGIFAKLLLGNNNATASMPSLPSSMSYAPFPQQPGMLQGMPGMPPQPGMMPGMPQLGMPRQGMMPGIPQPGIPQPGMMPGVMPGMIPGTMPSQPDVSVDNLRNMMPTVYNKIARILFQIVGLLCVLVAWFQLLYTHLHDLYKPKHWHKLVPWLQLLLVGTVCALYGCGTDPFKGLIFMWPVRLLFAPLYCHFKPLYKPKK